MLIDLKHYCKTLLHEAHGGKLTAGPGFESQRVKTVG